MFWQNYFTRRKFISGALYGFLYDNLVQVISPKEGKIIWLIVMLKSSDGKDMKQSEVKIVYDPISTGKYLAACNLLAKSLSSDAGITCRHNKHYLGKMRVFGYGKDKVVKMEFTKLLIKTEEQKVISQRLHNCVGNIILNVAYKKK